MIFSIVLIWLSNSEWYVLWVKQSLSHAQIGWISDEHSASFHMDVPLLIKLYFFYTKGGGTQQSFKNEGSSLGSNPLPFYIPFLTEKIPLSYTFNWQMISLSRTYQ